MCCAVLDVVVAGNWMLQVSPEEVLAVFMRHIIVDDVV